jgi:hypothetical protein
VDPRADLDDAEKRKFLTLPGLELRFPDRPARSQSLYRLHYPGSATSLGFKNVMCDFRFSHGGEYKYCYLRMSHRLL